MTPDDETIRITRGQGGEVEVSGRIDAVAKEVLLRAGFLFLPALRGRVWVRLPFDLGRDWENRHATWAAGMLSTARYRVHLDPDLRYTPPDEPATPARPPAMTAQAPPSRPQRR
ncbi:MULTISPECIES: hypothetical protein [Streptomyces]|uniref:Uncharacterized protein n=1 Tax=Streptomyces eurythermus TaxID=42237 RepID=A0ABW6Z5N3_9ACTN|nr:MULTISPECIES: hypothetical protein [Streptomyces]QIS75028.1 hypothetical protein HB370_37855 [Streptomyces sp. DSM 40868]